MTLLIVGLQHTTFIALDAPALKISRAEKSSIWMPFRRVRQIVSGTKAHWEPEAIIACAEKGIPIIFCNARKQMVARLGTIGRHRLSLTVNNLLAQELALYLTCWHGRQLLTRWFAVRRQRYTQLCKLTGHRLSMDGPEKAGSLACINALLLQQYDIDETLLDHQFNGFSLLESLFELVTLRLKLKKQRNSCLYSKVRQTCRDELHDLHRYLIENRHELEKDLSDLL